MRAAATAQPVFERNPKHPGAAHYIIHSFDDPIHAPLGLPAPEVYADVAPNAAHAQHMRSHIFVALGLWERVVEANIRAGDKQDGQRAEAGQRPKLGVEVAARALVAKSRPGDPMAALQVDQLTGLLALRDGEVDKGVAGLAATRGE